MCPVRIRFSGLLLLLGRLGFCSKHVTLKKKICIFSLSKGHIGQVVAAQAFDTCVLFV